MRPRLLFQMLLLLSAFLSGCGRSGADRPFDLITVTVSPATATLTTGTSHAFQATLAHATNPDVNWSIREGEAGGTVAANGTYTAPDEPGIFHLVATSIENSRKEGTATIQVVRAPEILAFTASAAQIAPGAQVVLVPTFIHGEGRLEPGLGAVTSGQQITVSPRESITYTLTVTNAAGTVVTATTEVTVVGPPAIQGFEASSTLVQAGQTVQLTPRFTGGTGEIQPTVGAVTSGLSCEVAPFEGTTYLLTVTNALGQSVAASVRIDVVPLPSIHSFTASPTIVDAGEATTLRPDFSGGTGSITPGIGPVQNGGAYAIIPSGTTTYTLTVTGATGQQVQAQVQVSVRARGGFAPTGPLGVPRKNHTATPLLDGTVLLTGGLPVEEGAGLPLIPLDVAERYHPVSGTFTPVGTMAQRRTHHAATVLADGRVLLCGGNAAWDSDLDSEPVAATATAEIFDPATLQFTPVLGTMLAPRRNHTATLLADGKVLVAGGTTGGAMNYGATLASSEVFDPATGLFTAVPEPMRTARQGHLALALPSGEALILGGIQYDASQSSPVPFGLSGAETFTAGALAFVPTATSMTTPRGFAAGVVLPNGRALVIGGRGITGSWIPQVDQYSLSGRSFSPSFPLATAIPNPTAARLGNGMILVVGDGAANLLDLASGQTLVVGTAGIPAGSGLSATSLPNGKVLIVNLEGAKLFDSELP